jgi:aldose 1-epimerase
MGELLLRFDDPQRYRGWHPHFGGIVGRYANRIAFGRFTLDGRSYQLACNNGRHHLHGGVHGFDRAQWTAEPELNRVKLRYTSADGEEGYPGTLHVAVTYSLVMNRLQIDYEAAAEAPTIINLTNHAYFNLAGTGTIDGHLLRVDAERYVAVDAELIPTGELAPVAKQFHAGRALAGMQLDHTFVTKQAELCDPASGRVLRVTSTQPGIQIYTGDQLDGTAGGYPQRAGVCLEPQHFPDSPNRPSFPSTVLRPGERYFRRSTYEFLVTA